MPKKQTLTILTIGLVTAGLGAYWWLSQHEAQAVSPNETTEGREGAAMDPSKESSLVNPLILDDVDDGVFPKAAKAALNGPGGIVPSLARIGESSSSAEVLINGFPVDLLGRLKFEDGEPFEADYRTIAPIHPYFLNPGKNQLIVKSDNGGEGGIAIVSWDYVDGRQHEELLRVPLPAEGEHTFSWSSKIPKRSWATGVAIEGDEEAKHGLYSKAADLHAKLQGLWTAAANGESTDAAATALKKQLTESTSEFIEASQLRGKPYRLIDQIIEASTVRALPGKPAGSLELEPLASEDELKLEIFAGGTLARLTPGSGVPLFSFISNLDDGPRGQPNTVQLAFDAWYRQNGEGAWELAALFPRLSPGTWTQFEQGPYELEDLFRLSNF